MALPAQQGFCLDHLLVAPIQVDWVVSGGNSSVDGSKQVNLQMEPALSPSVHVTVPLTIPVIGGMH